MSGRIFLTLICLSVTSLSCSAEQEKRSAAYELGKADAQKDLKAGKLANETYGLPSVDNGKIRDLLKKRYNIDLRMVAGCIVSTEITDHAHGYNEVMNAEIHKRFGENVFVDAQKEIAAEREKKDR